MTHKLFSKIRYVPFVARITTSVKNIEEIRKKVNEMDNIEIYNFFEKKLLKDEDKSQWHLSPFGLVWTKGDLYNSKFKGQGYFSLRHVLEEFHRRDYLLTFLYHNLIGSQTLEIHPFHKEEIQENFVYVPSTGELKNQEIYIQEDPEKIGFYIIWDGVSRVATHQLVRHQSFDYQQQSQRYINFSKRQGQLTGVYVPSAYLKNNKALELYIEKTKEAFNLYNELINKYKIKPEDARMLYPQSSTSRIIFYALKDRCCGRDGIKEFIEKRKYHGQEEIKNFALTLEKILKNY